MQDQEQSRPEVQTPDPATEMLDVEQVAKELGLKPNKIREFINTGELLAFRPNSRLIRVSRKNLRDFIDRNTGGEFGRWATN
jgi:hypothetical protein